MKSMERKSSRLSNRYSSSSLGVCKRLPGGMPAVNQNDKYILSQLNKQVKKSKVLSGMNMTALPTQIKKKRNTVLLRTTS
mmetsp:Transcript_22884/g.22164  ORF Transcript_22884/g.22164 Transcript_22884/m.22164 type:complete len:80 (+) Transcript_22884:1804-2043(+)